jgi:gamma-glutamylcyclotransferase (GGCT)/AIG2-like uncharacterized protein YtfP
MTNDSDSLLVFVYGSLKRGEHNHRLLARARFVGEARTQPCYRLRVTSSYPAMIRTDEDPLSIEGEVFDVDRATLARLDRLEDNGRLYQRELIPVVVEGSPEQPCQVWAYVYLLDVADLAPWPTGYWTSR